MPVMDDADVQTRTTPRELAAAALIYLGLLVAVTWPLAWRFTSEAPGHPWLSIKIHLWQFWWTKEALLSGEYALFQTPLLYYPLGLNTLTEMGNFLLPLLSVPPQLLFGLAGGFNATFFLVFTVAGVASYALCRRFVAGRAACLAGGAAVLFLPYAWMKVFDGEFEIAALLWLPVCLLQLDRLIRRPTIVRGALLGLLLFLTTMSSWYYGLFMGGTVALGCATAIGRAWRGRRATPPPGPLPQGEREHSGGGRHERLLTKTMVAALIALALFGALVYPFALALSQTERVAELDWLEEVEEWDLTTKANPDVLELLGPWQQAPTDAGMAAMADYGIPYPFALFPGVVNTTLALLGLTLARRIPAHLWVPALCFWLISLGPWLKIAGQTDFGLPFRIRLPAFYLASHWRGFAAITIHSYRAAAVLLVLLCIPAALGMELLLTRLPVGRRTAAVIGGAVLLLMARDGLDAARIPVPIPRTRVGAPQVYRALAAAEAHGAVLNLPLTEVDHIVGDYMLAATVHGRPILTGRSFESRIAPRWKALLPELLYPRPETTEAPASRPAAAVRRALLDGGVTSIVLHDRRLAGAAAARAAALVAEGCERVAADPERHVRVFRLFPEE